MQGLLAAPAVDNETFRLKTHGLLDLTSQLSLLQPAVVYDILPIRRIRSDRVVLENGKALEGSLPAKRLRAAQAVALVVCTIGPRLEAYVKESFDKGNRVQAVLLDGIGSAAVEELAQKACHIIREKAISRSLDTGSPLLPGTRGFPLSQQHALCRMADAFQIGVRLTETAMMEPRKSTALVVGLGKRIPQATRGKPCDECNLGTACRFRLSA